MKRLFSLLLGCLILFSLVSCSENGNPVEEAIMALKRFDLDSFYACMTSDSEEELTKLREKAAQLTEEEKKVLAELYETLHYTLGETTEADGKQIISVKVSCPDLARVRALAEKKILVRAEPAEIVVAEMLESGEITQSYMLTRTWQIVLKKEDSMKIAYADQANEAFVKDLYLMEMISFFVQN